MTIAELNQRYGAPGRIVFHVGHCGYPEVVLTNKYGAAEVALLGANTLSYRPTGHSPVIFRPAKRDYNRGESFHGGAAPLASIRHMSGQCRAAPLPSISPDFSEPP